VFCPTTFKNDGQDMPLQRRKREKCSLPFNKFADFVAHQAKISGSNLREKC